MLSLIAGWLSRKRVKEQAETVAIQIKMMVERAKALQEGNDLIKFEAGDLEPELEKIMVEIIKKIKIKAGEYGCVFPIIEPYQIHNQREIAKLGRGRIF